MNTPPPVQDPRRSRADGEKSRERLLLTAMQLFAEQGFERTSTREIALAAGTNVAAIAYYFGDKAGLYRAAFRYGAPLSQRDEMTAQLAGLPIREALLAFYGHMLSPVKLESMAQLCVRLLFREMLEPTGLWEEEVDVMIKPIHAALCQLICRALGLSAPDDDIARLAFCLEGLVVHPLMVGDVVAAVRPPLMAGPQAIDGWAERATDYALAMIEVERARRPQPRARRTPDSPISRNRKAKT